MALKDRIHFLTTPDQVDQFLKDFLFKDGKTAFDRDNWDITSESIAEALEGHFARV